MLGVVILHEFMPLRIDPLSEWQQRLAKGVNEELCIHDPLKDADSGSSSFANPGPHMDFCGVLWPIRKYNRHA